MHFKEGVIMLKNILLSLVLILTLAGCSEAEPVGEYKDVKVVKTNVEEHCMKGCWDEYTVTLQKGDIKIDMYVATEGDFKLLKKGNVVTVEYNEEQEIIGVKLPTLEGDEPSGNDESVQDKK